MTPRTHRRNTTVNQIIYTFFDFGELDALVKLTLLEVVVWMRTMESTM